jgi:tetratricopeptide (TPR) repeat protein
MRVHRGNYLLGQGRDPVPEFASAQAAFETSLQVAKGTGEIAGGHAHLGLVFSTWATHLWKTNRDPSDLFQKAETHFTTATKAAPTDSWFRRLRATALVSRAEYRESRSEDPFEDYAVAEDELQRAIDLRKDFTSAWRERAQLRFGRAAAWEKRGRKDRARQDYSAAANDYLETLSLNRLLRSELEPRMAEAKKRAADLAD